MARGTNLERVQDLQRAMKRARPDDVLSLAELALIWGIGKGAFVNIRNRMGGFPDAAPGPQNSLLYPALKALKVMLEHETRADAAEQERASRAAAILGMDGRKGGRRKADEVVLPPSELLKLSRLRAEIEERERTQGEYVKLADVRAQGARVYSVMSETLGQLSMKADPNGLWPPEVREAVDKAGRQQLLVVHRELSDMLGPDADSEPSRPSKSGNASSRARGASPRRRPPQRLGK